MKTLTIKNIPDDVYQKLQKNAEVNQRSIHDEVLFLIKLALMKRPVGSETNLELAYPAHEIATGHPVTADKIEEMIDDGRTHENHQSDFPDTER